MNDMVIVMSAEFNGKRIGEVAVDYKSIIRMGELDRAIVFEEMNNSLLAKLKTVADRLTGDGGKQ